jgi:hypothetical protein
MILLTLQLLQNMRINHFGQVVKTDSRRVHQVDTKLTTLLTIEYLLKLADTAIFLQIQLLPTGGIIDAHSWRFTRKPNKMNGRDSIGGWVTHDPGGNGSLPSRVKVHRAEDSTHNRFHCRTCRLGIYELHRQHGLPWSAHHDLLLYDIELLLLPRQRLKRRPNLSPGS